MYEYVGSHESRVCEESGVDVVGLFASFFLEGSDAFEFAEVSVHVEEEVEFEYLFDVALNVNGRLIGVETAGEVFGEDGIGALNDVVGFRVCGERVPVGDEEITVIVVLHADEVGYRTEIVAEMKVACWANAAYYFFHV